jgi:sugar lactone lactonase YvrE
VITTFDSGPFELAEGPVFDARSNALLWVDIKAQSISHRELDGVDTAHIPVGEDIGCIALTDNSDVLIAALRSGWYAVNIRNGEQKLIAAPSHPTSAFRFNDGAVDVEGRLWTGSLEDKESEALGELYRLDTDHSFRSVDAGFVASNGIDWSVDNEWMYFVDSRRSVIYPDLAVMYVTSASVELSQAQRREWPTSGTVLKRDAPSHGRAANLFGVGRLEAV